jgi:serine/threonine protein phosphatase PrpC
MTEAVVTQTCPACGAFIAAGDRFCEACGAGLGTEPVESEPAVAAAGCTSCGADVTQLMDGYCNVCGARARVPRDHIELAGDGVAAVSDRGKAHFRNEDAFAFGIDGAGALIAVVCDGVSTTASPDQASEAAAEAAMDALRSSIDPATRLDRAFDAAAAAVIAVEADEPGSPPSSTFLALTAADSEVRIASFGDCRAYWVPDDGDARVLHPDDSIAAERIAAGVPAEDAYADPSAHTITRWLGRDSDPGWRPRVTDVDLQGPGLLIACSDGLWNYAQEASALSTVVRGEPTSELIDLARRLVTFANDAGGHDNITVVLARLPWETSTEGTA